MWYFCLPVLGEEVYIKESETLEVQIAHIHTHTQRNSSDTSVNDIYSHSKMSELSID